MAGNNYYLITALPALGELGSEPPLEAAALLEHVRPNAGAAELVETVFLGDDLLQREALLAGELDSEKVSPAVLTAGQVRDDEPLPDFLAAETGESHVGLAADAIWAAYYRHVAVVADRRPGRFLTCWLRHEVALRNTLAAARAKALELDPTEYVVAAELGGDEYDSDALLAEWASARDGLAGLAVLDKARWNWLAENDAWFTFADDELAAYAVKLLLLHRWKRLAAQKGNEPREQTM